MKPGADMLRIATLRLAVNRQNERHLVGLLTPEVKVFVIPRDTKADGTLSGGLFDLYIAAADGGPPKEPR